MNRRDAQNAIEAILASIPDEELPQFDKVEVDGEEVYVWYGGSGRRLGSAKTGNTTTGATERKPIHYRESAAREAIELEMVYRADLAYFNNGDKLDGLNLGKVVTR